jgi:hypothetical protein
MKRKFILLAVGLFVSLLLASNSQILLVRATVAETWGNLCPTHWNYYNEYSLESSTCSYISNMFPGYYSSYYNYGDDTRSYEVYEALDWIQENEWYSTNLWVGDYFPSNEIGYVWEEGTLTPEGPTGHYNFYGADGYHINDNALYTYVNNDGDSIQYFNFIWTCTCGGSYWDDNLNYVNPYGGTQYGYYDTSSWWDNYNNTGVVGMPYAWTGRTDLSLNGVYNPSGEYCYIGWLNLSHGLCDSSGNQYYPNYAFFLYWFYYFLTGHYMGTHYSVYQSLDYASLTIWGENFTNSPIYYYGEWRDWMGQSWFCKLEVLGNPYISLPYY